MSVWRYRAVATAIAAGLFAAPGAAAQFEPAQQATPPPAVAAPRELPPGVSQQRVGVRTWDVLGLRGFSVALVVGDMTGATAADNLPAGAKKALTDMRDFLPYKGYRLVDTHWILCCSGTHGVAQVSGRLRGAEEEEYAFYITVRPAADSPDLGVEFNLREASTPAAVAHDAPAAVAAPVDRTRRVTEATQLMREREDLERRYSEARKKLGDKHPDAVALRAQLENVQQHISELDRRAQPARTPRPVGARHILDSTFSMKVGETVVIGTSRLKGDKALIALLTAASKAAAPGR
jgi:hypothetical protein